MNRNPNIAVITIGYNHYAFEDAQTALELMAIMSRAVQVEVQDWSLRDYTPCTHFLEADPSLPKLEFVASNKFNPHETVKEVKERKEREEKDRADVDQQFREAPAALAAPVEVVDDGVPF